jgi:antitoxin ParD1/3/4
MGDRSFSLTEHLSAFVDEQVRAGRHSDASQAVCEALRRYEEDLMAERANLAVIERVAAKGIAAIERGDYALVSGPEGAKALLERVNKLVDKKPRG